MKKFVPMFVATIFFLHLGAAGVFANEVYTVKSGDNLWKIAQAYNTTVNNLIVLNNLENDFLNIGQKLIIKSSTTNIVNNIPDNVETTTPQLTPSSPNSTIYLVKAGDNLWLISNQYNTTIDSIKQLNNLVSDALYVGQELIIPNNNINLLENVSRGGTPFSGDRIIQYAAKYIGTPYRYGGRSPGGFDCSGFTSYIFEQFKIKLNRTAADQYKQGVAVTKDELEVGDLVFFASGRNIDHVGIYSGNGQIIHSSSPSSGGVIYSSLNTGYYAKTYVGAKRIR